VAGCTGRHAVGAEVGHDRCGCVGHNPSGGALRKASATTDEAAAARRGAEKRRAYNRLAPNGCPLVPYWLETYGRLGKQVVALLGMLDAKAAAVGDISKSGLATTALREISVGLCMGNYLSIGHRLGFSWGCWLGLLPGSGLAC
jgi:hypothetical protein